MMISRRVGFAIFTLISVIILCLLGIWQLNRMSWKTELITNIVKGFEATPVVPNSNLAEWRRVALSGQWLSVDPIFVGPISLSGRLGWYSVSAFRLVSGKVIFVNRGWVDQKNKASLVNGEKTNLIGVLRRPKTSGLFLPTNDQEKKQWLRILPKEFALARDLVDVAPYWVELTQINKENSNLFVLGGLRLPPNNHLQYAITWFAFALISCIFGILFWIKNE
ncbi:MAG: hypothetical protein CMM44_10505 [Rhodospirillaceae bacterium]|nr:hypothetical protein [Rhodospirillaceae bacterium]|tara:strand:+ start:182 stop:847 length:666 start_codon:yes stop_codon:yes gene_type:complete